MKIDVCKADSKGKPAKKNEEHGKNREEVARNNTITRTHRQCLSRSKVRKKAMEPKKIEKTYLN